MTKYNIVILLISETKTDSSFHTAQFYLNGFTTYRCDRNINGIGILLHDRDDTPSNVLSIVESVEGLYGEIKIRKKKWRIDCSYNAHKNVISVHLKELGKNLNLFL